MPRVIAVLELPASSPCDTRCKTRSSSFMHSSHVKRWTVSMARACICFRIAGSASSSRTRLTMASASSTGTRKPLTPSSMMSLGPPQSVATTTQPHAIASRIGIAKPFRAAPYDPYEALRINFSRSRQRWMSPIAARGNLSRPAISAEYTNWSFWLNFGKSPQRAQNRFRVFNRM